MFSISVNESLKELVTPRISIAFVKRVGSKKSQNCISKLSKFWWTKPAPGIYSVPSYVNGASSYMYFQHISVILSSTSMQQHRAYLDSCHTSTNTKVPQRFMRVMIHVLSYLIFSWLYTSDTNWKLDFNRQMHPHQKNISCFLIFLHFKSILIPPPPLFFNQIHSGQLCVFSNVLYKAFSCEFFDRVRNELFLKHYMKFPLTVTGWCSCCNSPGNCADDHQFSFTTHLWSQSAMLLYYLARWEANSLT